MAFLDLLGHEEPRAEFKDIRNTRESVAARKAELLMTLGGLIRKVPACVLGGGIQTTQMWAADQKAAAKVAASKTASVPDIEKAITTMQSWLEGKK